MLQLPTGTITFLFTDIEGSTRLLQELGESFRVVVDDHGRILRDAIAAGDGTEVSTEGDAFFAVFPVPEGALRAVVQAQLGLAGHPWPGGQAVRVRMGLHTGHGELGGDNYIGLDVHRAARIAAAAHGGQTLLSEATRTLVDGALAHGVGVRDMGRHRLKDLERHEHLYQLIVDGLSADFPPIRTLAARLTNLPAERTSFVGRERESREVVDLLQRQRLVTLTGPGGSGKTRLALKVGADYIGLFADGVYLVDLSPITDPELVPSAIAETLKAREQPGHEVMESLSQYLADRELLLIIDNFEQVVAAAPVVTGLLDAAPGIRVLATSRVPLHLSGEHQYDVPPLSLPKMESHADAGAVARTEAVALFAERAAAVLPGFRVTDANARTAAEITSRLDGLPLAIELAAGRLKLLPPEVLLTRLNQRLPLLMGGARDLPERQRTLRRTIEWSYEILTGVEKRLLARLAAFAGGWTLETAEAICGLGIENEVFDGLESLVNNNLVRQERVSEHDIRFRMLETIHEFAAEQLTESGEEDEIRRRHAEHFRNFAEEAERQLTREDRHDWFSRLESEHDNLRAALDWAERGQNAEIGLRIATAIWRFWLQRGHLSEGRVRLERLLSLPGTDARGPVRARALGALGGIAYWQNAAGVTRAAYEEATEIAREVGDPGLLARSLLDLQYVHYLDEAPERTEPILREGLALAEQAGDRVLTAEFMSAIAFLDAISGSAEDGIARLRDAIAIFRMEGEAWRVGDYLGGLSMLTRSIGDLDAAKSHAREALQIVARAHDSVGLSMVLWSLALMANDQREHGRAARFTGAAARIRDDLGGGIPPEMIGRWGNPEEDARRALGDEVYERARAEGYALSMEDAIAYALSDVPTI